MVDDSDREQLLLTSSNFSRLYKKLCISMVSKSKQRDVLCLLYNFEDVLCLLYNAEDALLRAIIKYYYTFFPMQAGCGRSF